MGKVIDSRGRAGAGVARKGAPVSAGGKKGPTSAVAGRREAGSKVCVYVCVCVCVITHYVYYTSWQWSGLTTS